MLSNRLCIWCVTWVSFCLYNFMFILNWIIYTISWKIFQKYLVKNWLFFENYQKITPKYWFIRSNFPERLLFNPIPNTFICDYYRNNHTHNPITSLLYTHNCKYYLNDIDKHINFFPYYVRLFASLMELYRELFGETKALLHMYRKQNAFISLKWNYVIICRIFSRK